jgi:branched-chain amino acid transport system permease protein
MNFTFSILGQMLLTGCLMGCIYGTVAIGFSLIFGVAKIVNFAHAGFVMWVMYGVFYFSHLGWMSPYVTGLISLPTFFILGYVVQGSVMSKVSLMSEDMQIVYTFGLLLVLTYMAQFFFGPDVLYLPASGVSFEFWEIIIQKEILLAGILGLVGAFCLHTFLSKTWIGKAIRASADNRRGAILTGLKVQHLSRITMGISLAFAALAGSMMMTFTTLYPLRSLELAILAFLIVVLGGLQNVFAAFLAGVVIGILEAVGTLLFSPTMAQLIIYIFVFFLLLFRPQGFARSGH